MVRVLIDQYDDHYGVSSMFHDAAAVGWGGRLALG